LKVKKAMIVEMMTNGLSTKPLGEVCEFKKGKQLSISNMVTGEYPVIGGGQKPAGYHNAYNMEDNSILCSSSGAYAGFISMYKTKVWASDCFCIIPKLDFIQNKYLYYYLKTQQENIYKIQTGVAQPHIYSKDISNLQIPIPSQETQPKIVKECERIDKLIEDLEQDIETTKEFANTYLNSFINTSEEVTQVNQEYANIIISEESDEESH